MQWLKRILAKAWMNHVCKQVKRKHFDVQHCSGNVYKKLTKNRNAAQRGLLHHVACGRHVTNDTLHHYSYNAQTDCCPFCHEKDGKEHRLKHCTGLATLRQKYHSCIQCMLQQPDACWAFGIVKDDMRALECKRHLVDEHWECKIPPYNDFVQVFVDGSSHYNEDWECCLAGSAVILLSGQDYMYELVERRLVLGIFHNSYRAEIFAVLLALQHFYAVFIKSDCESVVKEMQRMLQCHAEQVPYVAKST